ncbi:MAG TPA: RNA methyltransferase [Thermoanaerobaculia bacterium]|nr:RNA methyltransferase [Thermoanaerobaculia bacterium]
MIASRQNRKIKDIRRLLRCKGEWTLLEGPHLVSEALAAGTEIETVLATAPFLATPEGRRLRARLPAPPLEVEAQALETLADADSPRGIAALARLPRGGAETLPALAALYLYLEGLQDPGNLGALARTAEAAGAGGIALSPGAASPNHPRALRASAGSLLRLPAAVGVEPEALEARLARLGPRWLALAPRGGRDLYGPLELPAGAPLLLAVGAEGPGLSADLERRAALRLTIPLEPPVESLNATVAAALVLFELRRRQLYAPS